MADYSRSTTCLQYIINSSLFDKRKGGNPLDRYILGKKLLDPLRNSNPGSLTCRASVQLNTKKISLILVIYKTLILKYFSQTWYTNNNFLVGWTSKMA